MFDRREFVTGLITVASEAGSNQRAMAECGVTESVATLPTPLNTILSPRSPIPRGLGAIEAFGADRVEWHYARSSEFIQKMREKGVTFVSGAINSFADQGADPSLSLSGQPNIAPWMRGVSSAPFISSTSYRSQEALAAWVQRNIDAGVDAIVYDDPLPLASAEQWAGGDFSSRTLALFNRWLGQHPHLDSDYAGYLLKRSDVNFRKYLSDRGVNDIASYKRERSKDVSFIAWRNFLLDADINQLASLRARKFERISHPLFSANLNTPRPSEQAERLMPLLDYFVSEINSEDIRDVFVAANMLASRGKPLVASSRASTANTRVIQQSIAASFAVGAIPLVPWDTYVPPQSGKVQPRYYGRPEDYAPLFHFFKNNAGLLSRADGASVGVVFSIGRTDVTAFQRCIDECIKWGVPFRIVVCGGELLDRPIRREDIQGLSVVIDPIKGGSLSLQNAGLLRNAGVRVGFGYQSITQYRRTFLENASENWCAVSRKRNDGRDVVFIVAKKYRPDPLEAGARLVIKKSRRSIGSTATLLSLEGSKRISVWADGDQLKLALPRIEVFGMIVL